MRILLIIFAVYSICRAQVPADFRTANPAIADHYELMLTSVPAEISHAKERFTIAVSGTWDVAQLGARLKDPSVGEGVKKDRKLISAVFDEEMKAFSEMTTTLAEGGSLYLFSFHEDSGDENGYLVLKGGKIVRKWRTGGGKTTYYGKEPNQVPQPTAPSRRG